MEVFVHVPVSWVAIVYLELIFMLCFLWCVPGLNLQHLGMFIFYLF